MSHPSAATTAVDDSSSSSSSPDYRVTSLRPSELDEWLDHLAASFAAKGTPRAYFHRHIVNDSTLDWAGIIVLRLPSTSCISSIRVFLRPVYIDGLPTLLGGIGEVSTQPQYRGRGYAEACLAAGVAYMASLSIHLSSLHTGNVAAYYHKLGWRRVERVHAVLPLSDLTSASSSHHNDIARLLPLSPDDLVPSPTLSALSSLYSSYAPHFNGPVHRSDEYWQSWVRGEFAHSLSSPSPVVAFTYHPASSPTPTAYLLASRIRWEMRLTQPDTAAPELLVKEHLAVREFACSDDARTRDGGRTAFLALVQRAAQAAGFDEGEQDALMVRAPLPVVSLFQPALVVPYTREDAGFMYRPIDAAAEPAATTRSPSEEPGRYSRKDFEAFQSLPGEELLTRLHRDARLKHVFFDTDAF